MTTPNSIDSVQQYNMLNSFKSHA